MSFLEGKKDKETTSNTYLDRFKKPKPNLFLKKKKEEQLMSFQERKKTKKQAGTYLDRFKKPKPNLFLKKRKRNG
jgi:hypothetical protein